ncbi:glycosyltransferase family A protein [Dendronalium sp. ChiSLP03b]|uniref:glycosyltransferase family A protein n=1 Tax=Dendronalium sp. ChiSLP03b TaxID=3075381 RepID=UPI002AD40E58|nr:glycosyltransferase family A protein [Dendronalium sp. ChiSLP03b]MDZ8202866.1 glycosyltransferase family A protein [Dendronalium sp. ChiSLP03b]
MITAPRFNYIITIHNKEFLIEKVLTSILMCCRNNSHIYPVLDGCTDNTEAIVDSLIEKFANVPITKVYTPDVHEILSINAGLRAANQDNDGYNIILQDDVILADFMLEEKVTKLYEWVGSNLGFVSFRLGANFAKDAATSETGFFTDYVENAYGHGIPAKVLLPGHFAYRTVPIKSPVCIPSALIRSVGMLEERLAPYMYDDLEYAIRCIKAGFMNGVFAIRFYSDIKWGTTRAKPDIQMGTIAKRNLEKIREWHGDEIKKICEVGQNQEIVQIPHMVSEVENRLALDTWEKNHQELERFSNTLGRRMIRMIKSIVKR